MSIEVLPGERVDDLQNGYFIIQDPKDFCFGIDAVLLAWFAKTKPGDRVLDLATGNGIVPILLSARNSRISVSGLEIQERSVELARKSVEYNGLQDKVQIVKGDIREASEIFGKASFSVVTTNPPYMTGGHGIPNESSSKMIARHEILCSLEDVIAQSSSLLMEKGKFYMIHRPFRLAEIMAAMVKHHLEPKRMRLVYPFADREPNLVLIEGLKGGNPRITVEKPLIVYESPGVYTEEILHIYGKEGKKP